MIKSKLVPLSLCLLISLVLPAGTVAQDEARAAWQVTNFDITVNNLATERALNARATITLRNVGRGAGSTLTVRMNSKSEVKNATVGAATAGYRSLPEPRSNAQRITITLPKPIAPNETVTAAIDYRLPVDENSGLTSISPVSSQFLPLSFWYPSPNTNFSIRGADYAPFRLTVSGGNAVSSGVDKSTAGSSVFEQSLNGQPFFVVGSWDRVEGGPTAKGVSAYVSKGANEEERKQAESLMTLAANARAFYASLLGATVEAPIRLVAAKRGAGFDDAGTMLIADGAFKRRKIDAVTALGISEAVARLWIGGNTTVRGEGYGVVREGLARFLATLFLEKEFGAEAAAEERARQRLAYAAVAKRDAPLSRTTPQEPTYFNSVGNKGAMVWRLAYNLVGRDAFLAVVREMLAGGSDPDGFSLARARAALAGRGGATLKNLLDQELDQPTDMDLMVGLPQQQSGKWIAALRNSGSVEAQVSVIGTTASGQKVTTQGTIPPHDFGQVTFQSPAPITRVEVDPEKFYPQIDYSNDAAPRPVDVTVSLGEAMRLFGTQEYAKAEALARQLLAAAPQMQEGRVLLGRALLSQNKIDEAEREFKQLADEKLPTPPTLAWTSIGLGEIALRRGQAKEAVRLFNEAVRTDAEYASTLTARAARIRAEAAAGVASPVDESARTFIGQLDNAIRSGRQADIAALIVPGELTKFVRGAVGTQPELWQTRVLRTETIDANQIAADVSMETKQLGVEHSGTAVFILARVGGAWKLNAIEFFEVR